MKKENAAGDTKAVLKSQWNAASERLGEKSRRVLAASTAEALGCGGSQTVHETAGLSVKAISSGTRQIHSKDGLRSGGIRVPGAGGKAVLELRPETGGEMLELAGTGMATQGDPMSPLQWTPKSLENMRAALEKAGFGASAPVISAILKRSGCSMQAGCKRFGGSTAAEGDSQLKCVSAYAKPALERHGPLMSADGKKKENAGPPKNGGKECSKAGCPIQADAYGFMDKKPGKAAPCGIYEADGGEGALAGCGADHGTAEFAVCSIEQRRLEMGVQKHPRARADHSLRRRRRRFTGPPAQTPPAGVQQQNRAQDSRPAFSSRGIEAERHRAQAVFRDFHELARSSAGIP
jgi:hypothetical protein